MERHGLLSRTIGTKEEENMSYQNTMIILPLWTVCVIGFSILEMAFYFLYSLIITLSKFASCLEIPIRMVIIRAMDSVWLA